MFSPDYAYTAAAQGSCVNIQYILYNVKQSKLGRV